MKKHLKAMLEALIADDSDSASEHLKAYLSEKTRQLTLGEKEECDDDDKKDKKDDDDDDKEYNFGKKSKKDDDKKDDDDDADDKDDDKDDKKDKKDVKENLAHAKSGAEDKEKQYKGYEHNHDGEVYHKVPHKDNSRGYGHDKSKAKSTKLKAEGDSGASAKKGDAYKDVPHKDNSRSAKSEDKGAKGLKSISTKATSPDSDGKKENRRTDKTAKYHGTDRGGKEV